MADKDTSTDDTTDTGTDDVETEDTSTEDEDTSTDDQEDSEDDAESDDGEADSEDDADDDDSEDDSDDDDSEDDEEDKPEFKKAFSQIKGDNPEEYIPNLEEAYRKSSREGKKLSSDNKEKQDRLDLINAAVAKNPELAKAIMDATGDTAVPPTADPALTKVRQDYEEKIASELNVFMEEHPDLDGDEDLTEEFMSNVAIVGKAARDKGKIIEPMIAYKKAWAMMDRDESKDKLANAAKKTASSKKTPSTKKPISTSKPKLSADQIAYGRKMGLNEKQLLATING